MIPRYSRPQMAAIWAPENRFRIWFEIEAHACDAMAELGIIPKDAAKAIWEGGKKAMAALKAEPAGNVEKIDAIERVTKHDVIAFLTWLGEFIGPQSRFVHQGMTSSDVLDTSFAVQLTQAADILIADVDRLLAALKKRALEHKDTLTIGRSHGIHAEPTTFGVKLAGHYAAFARNRARLVAARAEIATCAISGPVGTFANVDPRVEEHVARKLGLAVEPVSTQVIPRDRHAAFFAALAVVASSIENLATEIRHLQRTEVREAEEFFSAGQKGSSSMPHKRNPVLTENLTGLARVVRSAVVPALENVTLWHERDISHSSVERYIAPDATGDARLRAQPPDVGGRAARGLCRAHEGQSRFAGRAGLLAARAAGAHPKGHEPRGLLRRRPAQRDGGLARQRLVPGARAAPTRRSGSSCPTTNWWRCSTWAITPSTSTRSSSGCSARGFLHQDLPPPAA